MINNLSCSQTNSYFRRKTIRPLKHTYTNTIEHADKFPYFIISLVHVFDKDKLKKVIKKYISKNYAELQKIDDGIMFKTQ